MLTNIFYDFTSAPINTTANVLGTGISVKFLDIAKQNLEISRQSLELSKANEEKNFLLEEILDTNKEIIKLLNIIISKIE